MTSHRKRKHRPQSSPSPPLNPHSNDGDTAHEPVIDPTLFIQAYEADLVRSTQAARSLEVLPVPDIYQWRPVRTVTVGDALIRWGGDSGRLGVGSGVGLEWGDEDQDKGRDELDQAVWADRYDVRLLLDALPTHTTRSPTPARVSPTGWSDLPSDAEDTFFLTLDETEDLRRAKRRRVIEQNREERLRALRNDDDDDDRDDRDGKQKEEVWGGSDEEPSPTQLALMQRTATHLRASPNATLLEMRILANHGGDARFAFLRGRWARAWAAVRAGEGEGKSKSKSSLGGLADYGESDTEAAETDAAGVGGDVVDAKKERDEAAKEARRARAREWAKKRRAQKEHEHTGGG